MTRRTVPNTGSNDRKRSVADSRQPCTANEQWRCRTKPCPGGKVRRLEKLICRIWRRHSVEALVNQNGELLRYSITTEKKIYGCRQWGPSRGAHRLWPLSLRGLDRLNWHTISHCVSSPGNRADRYAELAVSSPAVAETIVITHCTYPRTDGQGGWVWVAWKTPES